MGLSESGYVEGWNVFGIVARRSDAHSKPAPSLVATLEIRRAEDIAPAIEPLRRRGEIE
jgi:hypothetical protein